MDISKHQILCNSETEPGTRVIRSRGLVSQAESLDFILQGTGKPWKDEGGDRAGWGELRLLWRVHDDELVAGSMGW